jgi:hypothetical protein
MSHNLDILQALRSASSAIATPYAAFWASIDGYTSDSVKQDGTLVERCQRTAYQYSWWEMHPRPGHGRLASH